jgi:hypothetical protein
MPGLCGECSSRASESGFQTGAERAFRHGQAIEWPTALSETVRSISVIRKTGLSVNQFCFINEARRRPRLAGEDCTTMEEHMISPIDRLMILTIGAVSSWLAVGGVALGASKLIEHLF